MNINFLSKSLDKKGKKEGQSISSERETDVILETPKEIMITLVPENLVKNYELLLILFNVSTPIATALWTAYLTIGGMSLLLSSGAFTLLSVFLLILIVIKRKNAFSDFVRKKTKFSDFK